MVLNQYSKWLKPFRIKCVIFCPRLKSWAINKTILKYKIVFRHRRLKSWAIFILLLTSLFAFGGGNVRVKGHKFILIPFVSGIVQKPFYGQLDIGHVYPIHYDGHRPWLTILAYSKLGAEFNFNFQHKVWAPEFSTEFELGFLCLRANIADFMEAKQHRFYFTPEAGLTLSGFITVAVGYNKCISKGSFDDIYRYRLSINWMLPINISGSSKQRH